MLKLQKSSLLMGMSALAFATTQTMAQTADNNSGTEQVVVSASRISIAGYTAATPVTVVGAADLDRNAQLNIADELRALPSVGLSSAPNVAGGGIGGATAGTSTVNLRNLGTNRTLVLVDSQRVVSASISSGAVDVGMIPQALIQRIDVVTGGASASWGSDAVAGVVNIVLNKNFTGFKADIEANDSTYNNPAFKEVASFGTDFDGSRGHFIISASHYDNPIPVFSSDTKPPYGTQLVVNPAYVAGNGQPYLIHKYLPNLAMQTDGGLINGGPLAGIAFDPSGQPVVFNQGTRSTNTAGGLTLDSVGGTPNPMKEVYPALTSNPYHNDSLFTYAKFKLTDSITASAQFDYSSNRVRVVTGSLESSYASLTLKNDYAYLPPSIVAQMAANKVTTLPFGSFMLGGILPTQADHLTLDDMFQGFLPFSQNTRQMLRGVFALDGAIGSDWTWNAYYQHGTVAIIQRVFSDPVKAYQTNALDAVYVTAANVGASGLPIGSIACRSTLTTPTNGCQPLDVIGVNKVSQAALNYINDGNSDINHDIESEDVASASMQGVLPWGLEAGKVAVAFGAEYRKEAGRLRVAPLAGAAAYANGNANAFAGEYSVEEGFLEVNAPILKNDFVQSLDASAAGRMTSYSTSGLVETWKLGLTSQVNDDFRLRTTWSVDIRAPSINELFSTGSSTFHALVDPHTGVTVPLVHEVTTGNPNLNPEVAITVSGGMVLTPHWIPGLSASFDWYSINIKGAIFSIASQTAIQQCAAGQAYYCSLLRFNGPGGALSDAISGPANAASQTVSGLDFQADYTMDLFSGTLAWRVLGNYTDELTRTTITTGTLDGAGNISPDSPFGGLPKFRATMSATYADGPWSGTVQGRFIGSAVLNNAWRYNNYVDNNNIPKIIYLDVRASYKWNDNIEFYGAMDNVANTTAPFIATIDTSPYQPVQSNAQIYDLLGRQYRMGIRFNFQ